jgi:hypothetical protein
MGTLTSWNPLGHSRPVTGLLSPCTGILQDMCVISTPTRDFDGYGVEFLGLRNAAQRTEILITQNSVAAWFLWLLIHIAMHVTDYICSVQLSNSPAVMEIIKNWISTLLETLTCITQLRVLCQQWYFHY